MLSHSQRSALPSQQKPIGQATNAMVGGDNASRSVAIGMVLGAYHGVEGIPQPLRDGLNAWGRCEKMLDQLAGTRAACAAAPQVKGEL